MATGVAPRPTAGAAVTLTLWSAASANSATTTYGTAYSGFAQWDTLTLYVKLTGATGGALDCYIRNSWDGTTFYDFWHPTQVTAAASAVEKKWSPTLDGVVYTIGSGTISTSGVALASGTGAGGHWGEWLQVVMVTGAGTSAGATQTVRALGTARSLTP